MLANPFSSKRATAASTASWLGEWSGLRSEAQDEQSGGSWGWSKKSRLVNWANGKIDFSIGRLQAAPRLASEVPGPSRRLISPSLTPLMVMYLILLPSLCMRTSFRPDSFAYVTSCEQRMMRSNPALIQKLVRQTRYCAVSQLHCKVL